MIEGKSLWGELFDYAMDIIDRAVTPEGVPSEWSFGGGTALMLQIDHRISYDIDFFNEDLQQLGHICAIAMDWYVDVGRAGYKTDGYNFMKLDFTGLGQVDFIITDHIVNDCTRKQTVRGRDVLLETVPEIIAKKIFHRGYRHLPRDIFDIAAACRAGYEQEIRKELLLMPDKVAEFAGKLYEIEPKDSDHVPFLSELKILPQYESLRTDALEVVQEMVTATMEDLAVEPDEPLEEGPNPT